MTAQKITDRIEELRQCEENCKALLKWNISRERWRDLVEEKTAIMQEIAELEREVEDMKEDV